MDGKKMLCLTAGLILGCTASGWAATPGCAAVAQSAITATAPLTRAATNPASNARISVQRDVSGRITVELVGSEGSIRKTFANGATTTTFALGGHHVTITLNGDRITVTAPDHVWHGSAADPESFTQPAAYLRQSTAAIAAKELLDSTELRPDTFEGNALLLTKALLGSLWGESAGTTEYQAWVADRLRRGRVVKASLLAGAGECWDKYAAEAARLVNEYADCARGCNWRFWCLEGCGATYYIRAEAAFMAYLGCSGGLFIG